MAAYIIIRYCNHCLPTGVVIGFSQTLYQATEGTDTSVQLSVNVLMGDLRRDVIVNFATEDGSALS